jgi:hypothetical protein
MLGPAPGVGTIVAPTFRRHFYGSLRCRCNGGSVVCRSGLPLKALVALAVIAATLLNPLEVAISAIRRALSRVSITPATAAEPASAVGLLAGSVVGALWTVQRSPALCKTVARIEQAINLCFVARPLFHFVRLGYALAMLKEPRPDDPAVPEETESPTYADDRMFFAEVKTTGFRAAWDRPSS